MKYIGLLGGMSWESTLDYYRLLNEGIRESLGGLHSARILLHSVDFAEIEQLQVNGEWEKAGEILADAATGLQRAGAEAMLICTNLMHKITPIVERRLEIPLLHIADATGQAFRARGLTKAGLLGTRYTMEEDFYRQRPKERFDIDVIIPQEQDRELIHSVTKEKPSSNATGDVTTGVAVKKNRSTQANNNGDFFNSAVMETKVSGR